MADSGERNIGLTAILALAPNTEIFDSGPGAVPAFGARRRSASAMSYFVMFRTEQGKLRCFTIGRHGAPSTPDMARDMAKELLGEVAKGGDPASEKRHGKQNARDAMTVGELCDRYLADAVADGILGRRGMPKKASTLDIDRGRVAVHIKPLIGT
jgi:hypothetical protein